MAIVTLPYPNMDFVPLDVLTADELDQIVANIDAINNASIPTDSIANSAITTAKLADDSVTSDKIDFSTLRLAVPDYASRQSFSSTTYTAPADGWVDIRATIAHGGDVSEHQLAFGVDITRGGITYQSIARSGIYSLTRWTQFNAQATVPVRSGDVVTLTTTIPSGGTVSWDARYFYPVKWN